MSFRWFLVGWIIVFTFYTGFSLRESQRQAKSGHEALVALCAFKEDLRHRVNAGNSYLKAHPNGLPGIPASVIRSSIVNQQKTLDALHILHCD